MTNSEPLPRPVLVARPFGYALITLVYAVLLAVMVGAWVAPFVLIDRGFGADFDAAGVVYAVLTVVLVGPILGPALVLVTGLTLSLTLLGGLAFVRSLQPRYAGTTLTATARSDDVLGPPRLTRAAISLLPTVRSRFAELCVALNLATYGASARLVGGCAWIGACYLVTVGWVRWPVTGVWIAPWALVSLALLVLGVRGIARAERHPRRRGGSGRRLP